MRLLLVLTIVAHHALIVVLSLVFTTCVVVFPLLYGPLGLLLVIPVNVGIYMVGTTKHECPITTLENYFRVRLGLEPIKGFIRHYYVQPLRNRSK